MGDTQTMTLTEFLELRIAEDEERAEWNHRLLCLRIGCETCVFDDDEEAIAAERVCTCGYPARVLAECAAKRRRVELFAKWDALCSPGDWPDGDMSGAALADAGRLLLRIEAQPYSDHPDFDPAWA